MTPDNLAIILSAIALLVGAVGFAIRMLATAFNSWVETRNKVQVMREENSQLKAQAEARDQDSENERDTKIVNILERLTEQNGRWPVSFFASI